MFEMVIIKKGKKYYHNEVQFLFKSIDNFFPTPSKIKFESLSDLQIMTNYNKPCLSREPMISIFF